MNSSVVCFTRRAGAGWMEWEGGEERMGGFGIQAFFGAISGTLRVWLEEVTVEGLRFEVLHPFQAGTPVGRSRH